jgi:D-sedoheptulose 7-phosphate isomerase
LSDYIASQLDESKRIIEGIRNDPILIRRISDAAQDCVKAIRAGGKILFAGNGGSAADAQHMAGEFVSRFAFDRPGMAAIALTTDSSILTAVGNDYGYELIFRRQVQALGRPGDVFVGYSTSGKSKNVLQAFEAARKYFVSGSQEIVGAPCGLCALICWKYRLLIHPKSRRVTL